MKKNFQYDFVNKAIIGSKSAISRANRGMNPEYKELSEMLAAMPSFSVQIKDIKKKKDKKTCIIHVQGGGKPLIRTGRAGGGRSARPWRLPFRRKRPGE